MILDKTDLGKILTDSEKLGILNKKIELIKVPKEWADNLEISSMSILLNIKIILYTQNNYSYQQYFEYKVDKAPSYEIKILFVSSNHFNLLYYKNHIFKQNINGDLLSKE